MVDNVSKWLADCSFENDQYNQWQRIERDIDSLLLDSPKNDVTVAAAAEVIIPNYNLKSNLFLALANAKYATRDESDGQGVFSVASSRLDNQAAGSHASPDGRTASRAGLLFR